MLCGKSSQTTTTALTQGRRPRIGRSASPSSTAEAGAREAASAGAQCVIGCLGLAVQALRVEQEQAGPPDDEVVPVATPIDDVVLDPPLAVEGVQLRFGLLLADATPEPGQRTHITAEHPADRQQRQRGTKERREHKLRDAVCERDRDPGRCQQGEQLRPIAPITAQRPPPLRTEEFQIRHARPPPPQRSHAPSSVTERGRFDKPARCCKPPPAHRTTGRSIGAARERIKLARLDRSKSRGLPARSSVALRAEVSVF
jgi:hypothetical protein